MLKKLHLDIVLPLLTAIIGAFIWFFGDFIPKDWENKYEIPLKINIFLIIVFIVILGLLIRKIISLKGKIREQVSENKKLTKFTKVDSYDLFQDSEGTYYCMIHKNPLPQTGPMGYSKGSYWCSECKFWYENYNSPSPLDDF
ncbi:hypothetical protein [Acinetobacter tandoii]